MSPRTGSMRISLLTVLVTLVAAAAAVAAGWAWLGLEHGREILPREPFPADLIPRFRASLPGELRNADGAPADDLPGSWPCFRGPLRDGVSDEEVELAESWPAEGPRVLWSLDLGEGYAGAAVHRGRVYLLDYDEGRVQGEIVRGRRGDVLRCLSLRDGKEIWRRWYHLPMVRYHGISRTVPAVSDRHVVSLGPMGHVLCVDADTGAARWSLDLVERFGTQIPEWYAAQCPLIEKVGGREAAILAPGGDQGVLMLAVDCENGEVIWSTPNPEGLHMTHASITPMWLQNRRTYVCCTTGGVVGVAAADGKLIWSFPDWRISPAIVPSPIIVGEDQIFLCGGYKAGSLMLQIAENEDFEIEAREVYRLDARTFGVEQQTPILYNDCLYGVLTRDAGPRREQLICLSTAGAVLWSSGADHLFQLGPFIVADEKLLIMDDSGLLTMARPSSTGYEPLASARILEGPEAWAPLAIAGGLLLARDLKKMVCIDLRAESYR